MRWKFLTLVAVLILFESFVPYQTTRPMVTAGGGFYQGGPRHSGGVLQLEYRSEKLFLGYFRPQVTLAFPECKAAFLGAGIGIDLYVSDHFIVTPSFEPGLYFKGKGRDLGHPLEFRSCFEVAYETDSCWRLGAHVYHISNASLGKRNPGAEALVFFVGIPL